MKLNLSCAFLSKTFVLVLTSALAVGLSGCAMGNLDLSGPAPISPQTVDLNLSGTVHGGQQPISGAVIQLNVVGSSAYGSSVTGLITGTNATTVGIGVTDSNGNFNLSGKYTCPAAPSNATTGPYVYITATGGTPGSNVGGVNVNSVLGAALGTCSSISGTTISINEVTTAAMAYALGQYFNTTFTVGADSFGAPNTVLAQIGLANAFGTAATLASTSTGLSANSTLTNGSYSITVAPETSKLYTVANILAACVNSKGVADTSDTSCSTLFANTGGSPVDTLQAAVEMSINPTSGGSSTHVTNLFNLQSAVSPYPGETAPFATGTAPSDWTIGILYTDTIGCTQGSGTAAGTCVLNEPQNVAIDSLGDVWIGNHNGSNLSSLSELSPTGSPLYNNNSGTISSTATNFAVLNLRNIAVDTNNNVWLTTSSSSGDIFEYSGGTGANDTGGSMTGLGLGSAPYALAIDKSNNVFIGEESLTTIKTVVEFPAGSTANEIEYPTYCTTTTNNNVACPSQTSPTGQTAAAQPEYAAIDTNGNVWLNSASANAATSNILEMTGFSATCTGGYPCINTTASDTTNGGYVAVASGTGSLPTFTEPYDLAAGPGGLIWELNEKSAAYGVFVLTSNTAGTTDTATTTFGSVSYVAVDGAGNAWISNYGSSASVASPISEISYSGGTFTALSGTGYVHSTLLDSNGVGIDPSGNVWVANSISNGTTGTSTASGGGVLEIVGAAAPTVTPVALALKNNAVGAKP